MNWSDDLRDKMALLSTQQRNAIAAIVLAEAEGIALTRLLKTAYSCRWCGRPQGRAGWPSEARKAELATHEAECERGPELDDKGEVVVEGQKWRFIANYATFYVKWKSSEFHNCLAHARQEVVDAALSEAAQLLQLGTPDAAEELRRQVREGEKDFDKRSAAIAILDRADLKTANKARDPMIEWLQDLRGDDGSMADDGAEGSNLSPDRVSTELDSG